MLGSLFLETASRLLFSFSMPKMPMAPTKRRMAVHVRNPANSFFLSVMVRSFARYCLVAGHEYGVRQVFSLETWAVAIFRQKGKKLELFLPVRRRQREASTILNWLAMPGPISPARSD